MLQLEPATSVALQLLVTPVVSRVNSAAFVPVKPTVIPDRVALPVLDSVTDWAALKVSNTWLPKASDVGATPATGAVPVPLRFTGCPVIPALLAVTVICAVRAPVAVGMNTMLIVQLEAAAKLVPQVPPAAPAGREKSVAFVPVKPTVMPVSVAPPVFDSVTV